VGVPGQPTEVQVIGHLFSGSEATGKPLANQTLHYTITDETTAQHVGSFTSPSNEGCGLVIAQSGGSETFSGRTVVPYPPCTVATPFTVPAAHLLSVVASFAGNSTYAPAASKSESF
jgi:hypothetical protein